ncbi:MAG: hypothetical protein NXI31_08580 [bacterium]|nr:hypothetical protein [bacterium]
MTSRRTRTTRRQLSMLIVASLLACDTEERANATGAGYALECGWTVRFDNPDYDAEPTRFVQDERGLEAQPGPNACLWHPARTVHGNFRISVDVAHLDSGLHPHGAGLAFGGTEVDGDNQRYTYFLVRGDRHFLIKTRSGDATTDVVSWTEHEALTPEDESGRTKNRLAVEARTDTVVFYVNGKPVHSAKRATIPTAGQHGYRLVHDLHVRFDDPIEEALD